ncbi:MAG: 50S ribosomal protein L24 [Deltaproteobacteria bacterium]|nr:50S ribosomal protein L24 [Deltaproteobacteria bacterium]
MIEKLEKIKIKKDDQVMVMVGKDRGKSGKVVRVNKEAPGSVIVEKLNMIKRHQKPTQKNMQGGIIDKEAPIKLSNVMVICPKCKGPVRVGRKVMEGAGTVRTCRKCGEVLDK